MTQPATTALTMQEVNSLRGRHDLQITPDMLTAINASDTFKGLMRQAIDQGVKVDINYLHGDAGRGRYDPSEKLITITADHLNDPSAYLGILAHELGHFSFESRGPQPDIKTKFVEHVAQRNASEAQGDAVAAQIRREAASADLKVQEIGASHGRLDELAKDYGDQSLASNNRGQTTVF